MELDNAEALAELAMLELVEEAEKELPLLTFEYYDKVFRGEEVKTILRRKDG